MHDVTSYHVDICKILWHKFVLDLMKIYLEKLFVAHSYPAPVCAQLEENKVL